MIKDIKELNFPSYATLSHAECNMQDMAEKTITSTVKIDGGIAPDFSYDWAVEFKGEKYIMPLRKPQAAKENTSLNSTIDLTFRHWAVYQLQRYYFVTMQPLDSGTAIADKYVATVNLNLSDFCKLFSQVLNYYYGDTITIDLNPAWQYSQEPVGVEISHSHIWDVLTKFYELFAVRWTIEPRGDNNNQTAGGERYVIKVGYPTNEISHIFQYGFEGGLLKVERQVQDENIRNILIGRGGSKNLPYRYFKDLDEYNPSFPADPDWIPELRNIYFSELRPKTFRDYVKGWKTNPRRQLTEKDGAQIIDKTTKNPIAVERYDTELAAQSYAYKRGHEDEKFNPVEFVFDEQSVKRYGELWGGLENNEEIFPSIQGVDSADFPYLFRKNIGRIDEAVYVEQVESDDWQDNPGESESWSPHVTELHNTDKYAGTHLVAPTDYYNLTIQGPDIEVEEGRVGTLSIYPRVVKVKKGANSITFNGYDYLVSGATVYLVGADDNKLDNAGIPPGKYRSFYTVRLHNPNKDFSVFITVGIDTMSLVKSLPKKVWHNTFNVWVKNIWGTTKSDSENEVEYRERVWRPILGDREGNEAKVVFSDGDLSISEDYEFVIVADGVEYDTSKSIDIKDENGGIIDTVQSEWKLILKKSDADLESIGLYVPSTQRQGKAGDHFFFTGIDMPHQYVVWTEAQIDNWKNDELLKSSDIKPTFAVSLDKVRINTQMEGEVVSLISQLRIGDTFRLADKRFIINETGTESAYETLYLQSITYNYEEPTSGNAALSPNVEVILSGKYETSANPVEELQGSVDALQRQVGSISNIQQVVRAVSDKLYLRKDGISDRSTSPTDFMKEIKFHSSVKSGNFRPGIYGGYGWGIYRDENGATVLETDKIYARQEFHVNTIVVNQIKSRGGMIVESAANMEIAAVEETNDGYVCYFDQKNGSVANLFHVDDVAWCSRFTPENNNLKFYKRRVIAVSGGSVTLTNGYAPVTLPDGTTDTGVNGTGIPEVEDVIVQYGNYTDKERQYAKVRDVIGGGYERYIEGLDSVNANGTEYYFVGRLIGNYGDRPRWFIGGNEEYIEWLEGRLDVSGRIHAMAGSSGAANFTDLPEEVVKAVGVGGENLLLNTGFVGEYNSADVSEIGTLVPETQMYGNLMEHWSGTGESVEQSLAVSGRACDISGGKSISQEVELIPGERYVLSFMARGSVAVGIPGTEAQVSEPEEGAADGFTIREFSIGPVEGGPFSFTFSGLPGSIAAVLFDLKLERGTVRTDWRPAREDTDPVADRFRAYDYIRQAIASGGTDVIGGLMLLSVLNLGNAASGRVEDVTAGMSGIRSTDDDVAIWAGGTLADAVRTVSMLKGGKTITDEEWNTLVGFCTTHGGDAFFRGFVYALGGVFRGRVEAEEGYFKGRILAKDGYFKGFIYKGVTTITPENLMDYVEENMYRPGNYSLRWDRISPIVEFSGFSAAGYLNLVMYLPSIYPGLHYSNPDDIAIARSLVGSDVILYNHDISLFGVSGAIVEEDLDTESIGPFASYTIKPGICCHLECKFAGVGGNNTDEGKECIYWKIRKGYYNTSNDNQQE